MSAEHKAGAVMARHKLTSLHIFTADAGWRAFGFRKDVAGFEASVESGQGNTIENALAHLDRRLVEGPIHKARRGA